MCAASWTRLGLATPATPCAASTGASARMRPSQVRPGPGAAWYCSPKGCNELPPVVWRSVPPPPPPLARWGGPLPPACRSFPPASCGAPASPAPCSERVGHQPWQAGHRNVLRLCQPARRIWRHARAPAERPSCAQPPVCHLSRQRPAAAGGAAEQQHLLLHAGAAGCRQRPDGWGHRWAPLAGWRGCLLRRCWQEAAERRVCNWLDR